MNIRLKARIIAAALLLGPALARAAEAPTAADLLGNDYAGAKIVSNRGKDLIAIDLASRKTTTLASFSSTTQFFGLSRPMWSRDGTQVVVADHGQCYLVAADGSGATRVLEGQKVYEPWFWYDPKTAAPCILYKDNDGAYVYGASRNKGSTFVYDLRTRETRKIADVPCDGGLSLDGTHLGDGFAQAFTLDLTTHQATVFDNGRPACHASMSPDNTYRLMHLATLHDRFVIRNPFDRIVGSFPTPAGAAKWQTPRFSNHPDFATAVAMSGAWGAEPKLVIIQISTGKMATLEDLSTGWLAPHLWLPSAAKADFSRRPGPLDGAAVPETLKARAAAVEQYGPLMKELAADKNGAVALAALRDAGGKLLAEAPGQADIYDARAIYRELAYRYAGDPIGEEAKKALDAKPFQDRLKARARVHDLERASWGLSLIKGQAATAENPEFARHNAFLLARMTAIAAEIRDGFPKTPEAKLAAEIAARYKLPASAAPDERQNPTIVLEATIEAVSKVPRFEQIAPYTKAVTFIRYKVDRVLEGKFSDKEILVAHWGMQDKRPTAAAGWKPGAKQRLTVDLFSAHKDLQDLTQADDINDPTLLPYWAKDAKPLE